MDEKNTFSSGTFPVEVLFQSTLPGGALIVWFACGNFNFSYIEASE
jgi:hypothetical protein